MRTNIVLDDELVKRAMTLSHVHTKKEAVHTALKEYVMNHSRRDVRELRGKIKLRKYYDYKSMR